MCIWSHQGQKRYFAENYRECEDKRGQNWKFTEAGSRHSNELLCKEKSDTNNRGPCEVLRNCLTSWYKYENNRPEMVLRVVTLKDTSMIIQKLLNSLLKRNNDIETVAVKVAAIPLMKPINYIFNISAWRGRSYGTQINMPIGYTTVQHHLWHKYLTYLKQHNAFDCIDFNILT